MIKITNQALVDLYEDRVEWIRYHARNRYQSLDWCIGALRVNFDWFRRISEDERPYEYEVITYKELSFAERGQYRHPELGDVTQILYYRDRVIPIYDDDYGQQDVALIDGVLQGAGAYNFFSLEEFMDMVDLKEYYALETEISGYYKKDE
jgi:hypothetical protein